MSIRTDFESFGTLMETSVIREVPLYQRRYSWTRQHIEALWDDILRLYKAREQGQPIKHFVGPLILGEQKSRGLRPSTTQIIDGQQRLMTLSLMITVIRDLLIDGDDYDVLTEKYLTLQHGNREPELRLKPGRWDLDAYTEAVISADEFSDESDLVARAYWWISDLLHRGPGSEEEVVEDEEVDGRIEDESEGDDWAESDAEDLEETVTDLTKVWRPADLLACIAEDLELAIVSDVPEERAYEIFATINATGLRLSQVDLVRNMIFVNVPGEGAALFDTLWQPMEDALGVKGLDAYLHCWVMAKGNNVSRKNTYAAMVGMLKPANGDEGAFTEVLREIGADCGSFILAAYPDDAVALKKFKVRSVPKGLHGALSRLSTWGSVPLQPVLFLVVKKWRENELSAVEAQSLVEAVEALVVRRYLCMVPPNDLRSSFARLASHVADLSGDEFALEVRSELRDPGRRLPSDDEVREACVDLPIYRNKPQSCFFILKRIATSLEGAEAPNMVLGTAAGAWSVEHLMPQSMPPKWTSDLRSWNYKDPSAVFQEYGNTLGNLTITVYNPDIGNLSFAEKKRKLQEKKHKLELSKRFLSAREWGSREIVGRSKDLADTVVKLWPAP